MANKQMFTFNPKIGVLEDKCAWGQGNVTTFFLYRLMPL